MARVFLYMIMTLTCLTRQEKLSDTGFYILITERNNCPLRMPTLNGQRTYCVPQKPVLDEHVFTSVSEIRLQDKRKYIDIYLSAKGMEALKKLVARLPNATYILAVDGKAIGVLKNMDVLGRFIRIDSDLLSKELEWVHGRLEANL